MSEKLSKLPEVLTVLSGLFLILSIFYSMWLWGTQEYLLTPADIALISIGVLLISNGKDSKGK